jgi:RNA polymerase sigma-70 factor (ECF subfamily)
MELARRAAGGNKPATRRLLGTIVPKVRGAVRAVLGASHPELDDAVQLALIGFVDALPAFRGECDPVGYARVIAVRTAIGMKKRGRVRDSRGENGTEPDTLTCARPSPSEDADADERRNAIRELLAQLPDEQAETLALRIGLGCTIEEIARETGAPIDTVRSRLRLAKARLRDWIESDASLRETFERP